MKENFYQKGGKFMSDQLRLGVSRFNGKAYVGKANDNMFSDMITNKQDVTRDFRRCVVSYCSESVEFEVDGMRFKATCERIN